MTRIENWPYTTPYPRVPSTPVSDRKIILLGQTFTSLLPRTDATLTSGYDYWPFFIYQTRPLVDSVNQPPPVDPVLNFDLVFRHRYFNLTVGFLQNATRCLTTDESSCRWSDLDHAGIAEGNRTQLLQFLLGQIPLGFDVDDQQYFRSGLYIGMRIGNDTTVEWDPNLDIVFSSDFSTSVNSGSPQTQSLVAGDSSVTGMAIGIAVGVAAVVALGAVLIYVIFDRRKKRLARLHIQNLKSSMVAEERVSRAPSPQPASPASAPSATNPEYRKSKWEKSEAPYAHPPFR